MDTATFEVSEIASVDLIANTIRQLGDLLGEPNVWTRGALARDAQGTPLDTTDAIRDRGVSFSLLGMIEMCWNANLQPVLIRAITHACEDRHWGSNLTRVNETINLPDILEALEDAAQRATNLHEEQRVLINFGELPDRTPSSWVLEAKRIELRELEQQEGTLWSVYTCWENITPSLLAAAVARREVLRDFIAKAFSDLISKSGADAATC